MFKFTVSGSNNNTNALYSSRNSIIIDNTLMDTSGNGMDMSGNGHTHGMDMSGNGHHHHNMLIQSVEPIDISNERVSLDNYDNLLLEFDVTNYTYVDLTDVSNDHLPHVDNQGHAHIYLANSTSSNLEDLTINEFKLGRSYDGTYLVSNALFNNYHNFKMVITMNNNMHNPYTNDGVNKVYSIVNLHYHSGNIYIT